MAKKTLVWVMLLCMLMGLGAGVASASEDQPVKKMHMLHVCTPQQNVYIATERIVQMYQEQVNPNFEFELEYIPDRPAYLQKLKTLIASNEMPDLFCMDAEPYASVLYKSGLLVNMGEKLDELGIRDLYLDAPLAWGRLPSGVQVGIPNDFSTEYFWYNKRMFEEAGVEIPTNFDEFLNACAKLKEAGFTPISVSGKESLWIIRYLMVYTYRYGGNEFLLDLARGKQFLSDEIGMNALRFVAELGTNSYFQEGFASMDYTEALNYFLGGRAAIYYMGTWERTNMESEELDESMQGNIDYFHVPHTNEGDDVGLANFAANSTTPICFSKEKWDEETARFVTFWANNWNEALDGSNFSCMKNGAIPPGGELTQRIAQDMQESKGAINLYDVELDPATADIFFKEIVSMCLGNVTPEDVAARIDASIQENGPNYFDDFGK